MISVSSCNVAVIGGGPAGLMAAEALARAGHAVTVYERKPSPGRKFLMAGRGGLNLTHSEPLPAFMERYGEAQSWLRPVIESFPPDALREWCEGLGQPTFIGSSGRVFPESFKASPLLRAWLKRLRELSVQFRMFWEWKGFSEDGGLTFRHPEGAEIVHADAALLAMGGASWPGLGSDGMWTDILKEKGVSIAPLMPANCGFNVSWSSVFAEKFAGQPLKPAVLSHECHSVRGEIMLTRNGIEGGAVYALSPHLRDAILTRGKAAIEIDLRPGTALQALAEKLKAQRGRDSFSNWMRKAMRLSPAAIGLLREADGNVSALVPDDLAALIKAVPVTLESPFSIDRAISSAGGIPPEELDQNFMLRRLPGVFAAGEMLDWEAPTGGYLLQAAFATGVAAANGMIEWLNA